MDIPSPREAAERARAEDMEHFERWMPVFRKSAADHCVWVMRKGDSSELSMHWAGWARGSRANPLPGSDCRFLIALELTRELNACGWSATLREERDSE